MLFHDRAKPDPELVAHGRRHLRAALAFLIVTSVATAVVYLYRLGPDQIRQQVVSLCLLVLLGTFLLHGRAWARWVLLAILLVSLWIGFPVLTRPGAWSLHGLQGTIPVLVMYTGYAVIALGLVWSKSVRAFFRAHRRPPAAAEKPPG